jgi:DNA polymerase-1
MIPTPPPPKYLLVDGNNLLMRAIHAAVHSTMSAHGVNTGPLHIFIQTLAKHVREEAPTHLGIAWDYGRSDFRTTTDGQYKAHRKSGPITELRNATFPLVQEFCDLASLRTASALGIEADDIIAHWWRHLQPQRAPAMGSAVILSSDKDFLQLVGPSALGMPVTQVRLSSAGAATDRWDADRVNSDMGCAPQDFPKLLALMGDTSDGVFGLRGIGPKKGVALLAKHDWDFARVCASITDAEDRHRIRLNFDLVDLRAAHFEFTAEQHSGIPATLPAYRVAPLMASDPLERFLRHYALTSTVERWDALWRPSPPTPGHGFRSSALTRVALW